MWIFRVFFWFWFWIFHLNLLEAALSHKQQEKSMMWSKLESSLLWCTLIFGSYQLLILLPFKPMLISIQYYYAIYIFFVLCKFIVLPSPLRILRVFIVFCRWTQMSAFWNHSNFFPFFLKQKQNFISFFNMITNVTCVNELKWLDLKRTKAKRELKRTKE